jgi:Histidine kinase-, DNA gyrase B-, and HSP90-like ATPase
LTSRDFGLDAHIVRSVHLPPAPRFMDAIGHNYKFETAVADLIDNSIDGGAHTVLARFIRESGAVTGFVLVDDGRGIAADNLASAMTLGGNREYGDNSLGYFGIGLKASSFSQANNLTLVSRDVSGRSAGMRWLAEKARTSFECDVLDMTYVSQILSHRWPPIQLTSGTVVLWSDMKAFPRASDSKIVEPFLQKTIERLVRHLGLVFHRIIANGLRILVDVEDLATGATGAIVEVKPIDPFGYTRSGANGYPKQMTTTYHDRPIDIQCHIWPGKSHLDGFKLGGEGGGDVHQGFYFYRNDRLLQVGGWNQVFAGDREHQLARVAIDIDDSWTDRIRMNPEKSSVATDSDFQDAISKAAADGNTFWTFLDDAREVYKRSRQRNRNRPKMVRPGKGFDRTLRRALDDEIEYLPDEDPFDIRWRPITGTTFLEVDRERRTLWLNKRYRPLFTADEHGSLNDAPLLKALLYLLTQEVFKGSYLGPRDKDCIDLWQQVLTAAARAELQ